MLLALAAIKQNEIQFIFLRRNKAINPPDCISSFDIEGNLTREKWKKVTEELSLDAVLPIRSGSAMLIDRPKCAWIPDFQHIRYPEFSGKDRVKVIESLYKDLTIRAELVATSSETEAAEFRRQYKKFSHKVRVLKFPSILTTEKLSRNPEKTISKYCIPKKYALVINQMWKHKNHNILPEAIYLACQKRKDIHLVVVGTPMDYRDNTGTYLSEFLQGCAINNVISKVTLLGKIERAELFNLVRCTAALIQPSLSEGWNISLEDAKALGVPIFCSDLDVHKEQVPNAFFFKKESPSALADTLIDAWDDLSSGMNDYREEKSLLEAKKSLENYGNAIINLSKELVSIHQSKIKEFKFLKRKTVIFTWTQKFNISQDRLSNYNFLNETNFFFGLGDMIRASVKLFYLSKSMGFNLIIDTQLHPIGNYLKQKSHNYSSEVKINANNIDYVCYGEVEDFICESKSDVLYIYTNDFFEGVSLSTECKKYIKELLTPNNDFELFIKEKMKKIHLKNYSIIHYRLGDDNFLNKKINNNFEKNLEQLISLKEENDVLITDNFSFKELAARETGIATFTGKISHFGLCEDPEELKDTLFEFYLLTRSAKIRTHCVGNRVSGFAKWASLIYDVPLFKI
jgi:glycosyltransferase involved in cell wall biosynthesis